MPQLSASGRRRRIARVVGLLAMVVAGAVAAHGGAACGDAGPAASPHASVSGAAVTFVELGSDSCVPCREMRPVMDAVARRYAAQVAVVFYDVYEHRDLATRFEVRVIPTQVFLDAQGKEFYRHEGFLPQDEIERLLAERGLVP